MYKILLMLKKGSVEPQHFGNKMRSYWPFVHPPAHLCVTLCTQ